MNKEMEVPIVEQVSTEEIQESLEAQYSLSPDGTIVRTEELLENPESPQEQMR